MNNFKIRNILSNFKKHQNKNSSFDILNKVPSKLMQALAPPRGPQSLLALNEAVKLNAATLVKSLIEADANPQLKDGQDGQGETAIECSLAAPNAWGNAWGNAWPIAATNPGRQMETG